MCGAVIKYQMYNIERWPCIQERGYHISHGREGEKGETGKERESGSDMENINKA